MDDSHFDTFVRTLSTPGSRRSAFTALLGSGFGLLAFAGLDAPDAAAKKNKKKRKRKQRQKRKQRKKNKGSGPCGDVCASGCQSTSIQQAIDDAEAGATIRLCAETYNETLTIEKDVTLIGAGDGEDGTVLDGQGQGSVVTVPELGVLEPGATVMLEGLRITGGNSGDDVGGGIANFGVLTLTVCTVTGNVTAAVGGGLHNDGTLTLTGCNVTDNVADVQGGGIHNIRGVVTLNGTSNVTGNEAGRGGGIYNEAGGQVILNGTNSVAGNTATDGNGGGIFNINADSTVTLNDDSSVTGNTATGGEGGGIYNLSGAVTLNDVSFVTDNEPDDCAGSGTFDGNACG